MAKLTPEERKQRLETKRIDTLGKEGFLPAEARYYAKFPISSSGMRFIRRYRAKEVKQSRKLGYSPDRYIVDSYRARGFTTKQGKINPHLRNVAITDQLLEPTKERDWSKVSIPPSQYAVYRKTWESNISPGSSMKMASSIPFTELPSRLAMYRRLRKNHFTDSEAVKIVTAKTKKNKLQELDLGNTYWRQAISERNNWYNDMYKRGLQKGMKHHLIVAGIMKEIRNYYKADSKRTPWDWLKWFSPGGRDKPRVDFITGIRSRAQRLSKKKMPYRTRIGGR